MDAARAEAYQTTADENAALGKGMGVGTIILISVVAIGVVAGIVYYVRKK